MHEKRSPEKRLNDYLTTLSPHYLRTLVQMARSDEAASFFYAVYSAVQEIPRGRVTTYGHIAALIGTRK